MFDIHEEDETILTNKLLTKIRSAIDKRKSLNKDKEYMTNQAIYEGVQWSLATYNKATSPFMIQSDINHVRNAIDIRVGSLAASDYTGELVPKSSQDILAIKTLNMLKDMEWKRLGINNMIQSCMPYLAALGDSYIELHYNLNAIIGGTGNLNEGAIEAFNILANNLYIDASALDFYESDHIITTKVVTVDWIKCYSPEWVNKWKKNKSDVEMTGGQSDLDDSGEIYKNRGYNQNRDNVKTLYTVYVKYAEEVDLEGNPVGKTTAPRKNKQYDDSDKPPTINVTTVVNKKENKKTGEIETVTRIRIKIYYIIDNIIVGENSSYPFSEYPIVQLKWASAPQTPYGIPLMRGLTVPQRMANLIESGINNIAMHFAQPTILISQESGINTKKFSVFKNATGMVHGVFGDVHKAIHYVQPAPIDQNVLIYKDTLVASIRSYTGISDGYTGSIGTAGATASGAEQVIGRATVIDNNIITQIEVFVEKLTALLIKFMGFYYRDRVVENRTKEENGEYTFEQLTMEYNMANIDYDFNIDLSIRTNNNKEMKYQKLKDLKREGMQYKDPGAELITYADLIAAADLDEDYKYLSRHKAMEESQLQRKAALIPKIIQMAQTILPNGDSLISEDEQTQALVELQKPSGDMDVIKDLVGRYEQFHNQQSKLSNSQEVNRVKEAIETRNSENAM